MKPTIFKTPDDLRSIVVSSHKTNQIHIDCNITETDVVYFAHVLCTHKVPAVDVEVYPGKMPVGRIIVMNDSPKPNQDDEQCLQLISDSFECYFNAIAYPGP